MGTFRPRRKSCDEELNPYDLALNIHQLMRLLNRGEVYDAIPELRPMWPRVIMVACAINDMYSERRQSTANRIWEMYVELHTTFLDMVLKMHETGTSANLAALKPIVKKVLKITTRWLVFHCTAPTGELVHVMV